MSDLALITGASGGIGEALARLIAADGASVVLVARRLDALSALANQLARAHGVQALALAQDLAEPGAADRLYEQIVARGLQVDVLVNNAGFATYGPFVETSAAEEEALLRVNVGALTTLTKHCLPGMVARRHGRVLNVASTAAFQPGPLMAVYYASKAYVLSFSEALAEEVGGSGVTVTCLCPGPTRTGFQERAQMQESKLFSTLSVMTAAEVARAGYDGMLAGRRIVIPGLGNKLGVQLLRLSPRAVAARVVRMIQDRRR
jgi:short-subunit dehydrogenase